MPSQLAIIETHGLLMPAAFYGRVSTDGLQEPISSRNWQLRLVQPLARSHNYEIVTQYFDEDTRQLPWKLRPVTRLVLEALADPDRGWGALFVAEPHRAFMGTQYADVLPLFRHYGVELYAPEYPTGYDHENASHQMQLAFHGVNAEAEITRTRVRVTTTMEAQTEQEGRFLGGRPPYGYLLGDAGPHPNPMKARAGTRLHRLDLDPATAPVVRRIFDEYLAGTGLGRIAKGLVADNIPSPSAHDPERNPHRDTSGATWCKGTVRAILQNPRYTGHQVWHRTRGELVLRSVHDVSLGKEKRMRRQGADAWDWSLEPSHPAIITMDEHKLVQARFAPRATGHGARRASHPYKARGVLRCSICNRKMTGHWLRNKPGYRCAYRATHALPDNNNHPKTIYLREDAFIEPLAEWLTGLFAPDTIDNTCNLLAQAIDLGADPDRTRRDDATRRLHAANTRIARCEGMLNDPDVDPRDITKWLTAAQAERDAAEVILAATPPATALTAADFRRIIEALPNPADVFTNGNADDVQQLLQGLGVELTYDPIQRTITASANPGCCATESVGGGT